MYISSTAPSFSVEPNFSHFEKDNQLRKISWQKPLLHSTTSYRLNLLRRRKSNQLNNGKHVKGSENI